MNRMTANIHGLNQEEYNAIPTPEKGNAGTCWKEFGNFTFFNPSNRVNPKLSISLNIFNNEAFHEFDGELHTEAGFTWKAKNYDTLSITVFEDEEETVGNLQDSEVPL